MNYKGSLKFVCLENQLVKKVVDEIQNDFSGLNEIKMNIELVNSVCNQIEDFVKYSNMKKVNKLELFFKIYQKLFSNLSEEDKNHLEELVDYLLLHNKIKARPLLKYLWDNLKVFLKLM